MRFAVGAAGLALCSAGWIDPDTPEEVTKVTSHDGVEHTLVFSDEFNVEGRSFADGHDPRWTSVNKNDYTNMALHFYKDNRVTTSNGSLNITTMFEQTNYVSAEDEKGYVVMTDRKKFYSSGLIQGWNKFCFTGGVLEIRAKLPGKGHIGGLWPAMWILGAMSRATYVGSTDWIWPWSFDKCDRDLQRKQEINACEPSPHYGMHSMEGRGSPEIDLLEAMPGTGTMNYGMKKPYFSASYQVAPGIAGPNRPVEGKKPDKGSWYEKGLRYGANTSLNHFFYGEELKHVKKVQSYTADAISANHMITHDHFNNFHDYRLEWATKEGDESLRWFLDGELIFEMLASTLHVTGAKMPDEPMHILLNTAVSSTWGFPAPCPVGCTCECYECGNPDCACALPPRFCNNLPADYLIDSVRVYQSAEDPSQKVGCSTDTRPTRRFIEGHKDRYFDPYNDEKGPLLPLAKGGAKCAKDADCGAAAGRGTCARDKCKCAAAFTGPTCKAAAAHDDIVWERAASLRFASPFIPSSLVRSALALVAALAAAVILNVASRRASRKPTY